MRKYKIQIARDGLPTVHGVLRGRDASEAKQKLRLPAGCSVAKFEEVAINHACFFDSEFDSMLVSPVEVAL